MGLKLSTIGLPRILEVVPAVTTSAGLLVQYQEEEMFRVALWKIMLGAALQRAMENTDTRRETGATIQRTVRRHNAGR